MIILYFIQSYHIIAWSDAPHLTFVGSLKTSVYNFCGDGRCNSDLTSATLVQHCGIRKLCIVLVSPTWSVLISWSALYHCCVIAADIEKVPSCRSTLFRRPLCAPWYFQYGNVILIPSLQLLAQIQTQCCFIVTGLSVNTIKLSSHRFQNQYCHMTRYS